MNAALCINGLLGVFPNSLGFPVIHLLVCFMRLPIWEEEQFILWLITCAPETANYIKEENHLCRF